MLNNIFQSADAFRINNNLDTAPVPAAMLAVGLVDRNGNVVFSRLDGLAEVLTAARTITAAENGKTFFLATAAGFAVTLPAPALGLRYRFRVKTAPSGGSYTVVSGSSANIIKGSFASAADAGGSMDSETSGGDTITFVDGQAVASDWIEVESDGTSWHVTGIAADEDAITITTAS